MPGRATASTRLPIERNRRASGAKIRSPDPMTMVVHPEGSERSRSIRRKSASWSPPPWATALMPELSSFGPRSLTRRRSAYATQVSMRPLSAIWNIRDWSRLAAPDQSPFRLKSAVRFSRSRRTPNLSRVGRKRRSLGLLRPCTLPIPFARPLLDRETIPKSDIRKGGSSVAGPKCDDNDLRIEIGPLTVTCAGFGVPAESACLKVAQALQGTRTHSSEPLWKSSQGSSGPGR